LFAMVPYEKPNKGVNSDSKKRGDVRSAVFCCRLRQALGIT